MPSAPYGTMYFDSNGQLHLNGASIYDSAGRDIAAQFNALPETETAASGSGSVAVADITDASANGRSLISAANYAAMRPLLAVDGDLISTTSLAADASKTISGCFSASYSRYKIEIIATGSANANLQFQFAASGSAQATAYYANGWRIDWGNTAANQGVSNGSVWVLGRIGADNSGNAPSTFEIIVENPFSATQWKRMMARAQCVSDSNNWQYQIGCHVSSAQQFNDFILSASTGTVTGIVKVKGIP